MKALAPVGLAGLVGLVALIGVSTVAVSLRVYDRWVARPELQPRIGVVDVAEVYRQKEAEFTLILTRASTEAERDGAMRMARTFAQRLPAALDELARDCSCPVLLRTALAAPAANTIDLTAQLRRKVEAP